MGLGAWRGLTAVGLVRLVLAVAVAIAAPAQVYALATTAGELGRGGAGCRRDCGLLTRSPAKLGSLIRAVLAVKLAIADPALRDAGTTSSTSELAGRAGRVRTAALITAITAVIIAITHEHRGQAGTVAALELMRGAHCAGQRAGRPARSHPP